MAEKLTIDATQLHLTSIEVLHRGSPSWKYRVTFDISGMVAKPLQKVHLSVEVSWPHHGLRENHPRIAEIENTARRKVHRILAQLIKTLN